TSAAYAQLGAMPMVMITGQKPILESKQGRFQIVDMVEMFKPVTKYAQQIKHGDRIPAIVREAFRHARIERPGAVHLELPEDIAAENTTRNPLPIEKVRRPDANEKAVSKALRAIEKATNPLILVGAGANRKQVTKMLEIFIEKTNIPFFTTQMGKGVMPDDHSRCLGTSALSAGDYLHCAIEKADLIINIGHDVVEKPPFFMTEKSGNVLHISFSPAEIDEVYFPQYEVIGDIGNALWQMAQKIDLSKTNWDFSYTEKVKLEVDKRLEEGSDDVSFPVKPQRYVADIRAVMDKKDIVCLDNGMYKLWFARNYRALAPNTLLLDNALATMGAGLPSAIMAKMVKPNQRVMAVCGDGGFMMNSQELETAIRLKLDLVVLILNNNGFEMIKWKQNDAGFVNFGLDFGNPNFVKYAESYGAFGHRVEKTEDFKPLLEKCFTDGGVHLIELPVDDTPHYEVLTKELRKNSCMV
ncbi:MAG: acetolactate synthase large subunit, partial [Candidatus Peregrinibacteria bacterium]|nr:acetolactate synthase large subunit [Candidatus Peregrinibacteria bacterium]